MGVNGINNSFFINRLKKGEEAAFEILFSLYFDKLYHFAFSYIENEDEAKEIIQNLFYKIWKRRKSLAVDSNLNAYLFTMVKNDCFDHFKHRKVRLKYKSKIETQREEINFNALQDDPSLLLVEKELQKKITLLVNQLSPKCKEVFVKSRFEGLNHKEIAKELNISTKTVENHISKALRHLRHELQEYLTLFL